MKLTLKLDLTEERLRRIRAGVGRGGRATRKEAKAWAEHVVLAAVGALPAPKVRTPKAAAAPRRTFASPDAEGAGAAVRRILRGTAAPRPATEADLQRARDFLADK